MRDKADMEDADFRKAYWQELNEKRGDVEGQILRWQQEKRDVVLLCYEAGDDAAACHRRALADWVKRRMGIDIREWGHGQEKGRQEGRTQEGRGRRGTLAKAPSRQRLLFAEA